MKKMKFLLLLMFGFVFMSYFQPVTAKQINTPLKTCMITIAADDNAAVDSVIKAETAKAMANPANESKPLWQIIVLIAVAVYEVIARLWPTPLNISLLDIIHKIIAVILPNRTSDKSRFAIFKKPK